MYIRCGDIFDTAFIARMISFARQADLTAQTQTLLTLVHGEAMLGCLESAKSNCLVHIERQLSDDNADDDAEGASVAKRLRRSDPSEMQGDTTNQCHSAKIEDDLSDDTVQDTCATKYDHSSLFLNQDAATWSSSLEMLDSTTEQYRSVNIETDSPYDRAQDTSARKFQTKDAETLRPVTSPFSRAPMFYYCLHRRRLKNVNLPK